MLALFLFYKYLFLSVCILSSCFPHIVLSLVCVAGGWGSSRDQYIEFLSDVLGPKESVNKALEQELQRVFIAVSAEEDSTYGEGRANTDNSLGEQVGNRIQDVFNTPCAG